MDGTIFNHEHIFFDEHLAHPRLEKVKEIEKNSKKCPNENIKLIRERAIVACASPPTANLPNNRIIRHYSIPDR